MQLEIKVDDLRPKKLFVATPMYGAQCSGYYCKSTNDLSTAAAKFGIDVKFYYLFNESLITRARNYCVDEFLRSDYTHLLFIDSDIGFKYQDVFTMMHLCEEGSKYDIVTGPYPKKTIAWEKIKSAVDKGFANENPFVLEQFVGDYVFNPAENVSSFKISEPVEIKEGGTGFMIIHRSALEKYAAAYPELRYLPDHARSENFDGSREITAFFDTVIDPETKRYLSEDYMFSQYARKIGLKVWLCPWMQLRHAGAYVFGGSLAALAAIDESPTTSTKSNPKNYLTNGENSTINQGLNRKQRRAAVKTKGK